MMATGLSMAKSGQKLRTWRHSRAELKKENSFSRRRRRKKKIPALPKIRMLNGLKRRQYKKMIQKKRNRFNQEEVQKATEHYLEESSSSSAQFKNSNNEKFDIKYNKTFNYK